MEIVLITRYKRDEILYVEYLDDRGLFLVGYTIRCLNLISKYLSFDGQWVLREMLIEENRSVMVNEALSCLQSYSDIGEVVAEKVKERY